MFVLNADGTDFYNFNEDNVRYKLGDIIEHDRLEGKYEVVHLDMATVTVRPIK